MFLSDNYAQIRCLECGTVNHIMPGERFEKLDCKCETVKPTDDYSDMDLDALRSLAKEKKIKSAMQMGKDKLLEKLGAVA